ncbi:hypothetical protein SPURM210S_00509 [Streptomyces purpurascens]|nr:hypothetical protein GCM10010303_23960 [Streptomyces purpurascens]
MHIFRNSTTQPVCDTTECPGTALPGAGQCLEHIDDGDFDRFVESLTPGDNIAFRKTQIHANKLHRVLDALRNPEGFIEIGQASFQRSTFLGSVRFESARIRGNCSFSGSVFTRAASFSGSQFTEPTAFLGAEFGGEAKFAKVKFEKFTSFRAAIFQEGANFSEFEAQGKVKFTGSRFLESTRFAQASFTGKAGFKQCTFEHVIFESCNFAASLTFHESEITGSLKFAGSYVHGTLDICQSKFRRDCQFGPILCAHEVLASDCTWEGRAVISVATPRMDLSWSRFGDSLQINARHTTIALEGARFEAASTISGVPELRYVTAEGKGTIDEEHIADAFTSDLPSVSTLKDADLSNLSLSAIDLTTCYFIGSHNLDKLRLEGDVRFGRTPRRQIRLTRPSNLSFWSTRRVVLEEQQWRRQNGWNKGWARLRRSDPSRSPIKAESVANVYRALRKAQEESKNEPGAADFYYGEMEMRRHAKSLSASEKSIITMYWAVSGYGLRVSRSLFFLMLLIATLSGLAQMFGFSGKSPTYPQVFIYYLESIISLRSESLHAVRLNTFGAAIRVVLKMAGPVLLGLSVLAVRNRVKR